MAVEQKYERPKLWEIMKFNVMLKTAVQKCTALVIWKQFGWCLMWACMMLRACIGSLNKLPADEINVRFPSHHHFFVMLDYFLFAYCLSDNIDISPMICFFSKQCSGEIEHLMPYFFLWSTCGFDNEKIIQFSVHLTELS